VQEELQNRVGQCVLTTPSAACYGGLDGEEVLKLGNALRFFGDGWQISKRFGGKRYWRVPVMDGEFVCEAVTGLTKTAVGGGNLLIMGRNGEFTRAAAEAAVKAISAVADVIVPFPGGIVRSGSKVGSKYKASASTNEAYCPTLKGAVKSALDADIESVLEIVIDGLTAPAVATAMRAGLAAIVKLGPKRAARRRRELRRQTWPASFSSQKPPAMKPLVLVMHTSPQQRLDLSPLVPSRLAGKTVAEIGKLELQTDRERVAVGDIFRLSGNDTTRVRIEGATDRLDQIGHEMSGGEVVVEGDVGNQAGRLMRGGRLIIKGNAGHLAASGVSARHA